MQLDKNISAQDLISLCEAESDFTFQQTYRLGLYFEQLWAHLINGSNDLELLHKNLQIIIDKQTYGEFDSIIGFQDKIVHCELAVKFYLKIGTGSLLSDWVGPNLKDRFDDKYNRIFDHQLVLSELPELQIWLKDKKIHIDVKRLLTRGRLFYPYREFIEQEFSFPKEINAKHDKGFWVHYSKLDGLLKDCDLQWYQLPRFYWLAEIDRVDDKLLPVEKDFSGFSLQKIVALKDGKEVMRGFVVNDDWLNKAQQRVAD